ncbi:MAG: AAA family ATPase [Patescibacteria group bacterium]|nr:AAA family ATPase [Patescibacteria group bacterium]
MPDGTVKPRRGKLLAVAPDAVEPKKPKVLIYGPPGVGKTWTSLDFPNVYYIDTEGGADLDHYRAKLRESGGAYLGPEQGSLDFDVVISQIQALATEHHDFRTVVLDSASKLWNVALSDEQESLGDKDAFGAYKKVPTRKFTTMIKWLNRLDMNAVIICHQKELWGLNNKNQREVIGYTFDCQEKLEYDLHLVLRIAKMGSSRYAYIGKSRLPSFPEGDNFDWSYQSFADRYGQDVIEKESKTLDLATPEQLSEIAKLLETIKVPDGWQDKVFKNAGVDTWEEMDTDKLAKYITTLKEKLSS